MDISTQVTNTLRINYHAIAQGIFPPFINESTLRLNIYDSLAYLKNFGFIIGEEFNIKSDLNFSNKFEKSELDLVIKDEHQIFGLEIKDNFNRTRRTGESFGKIDLEKINSDLVFMQQCKKSGFTKTYIFGTIPSKNRKLSEEFFNQNQIEFSEFKMVFNGREEQGLVYFKES